MNHREPPHLAAATRRALHCLSLLLLPTLVPTGADALPRGHLPQEGTGSQRAAKPAPYLPIVGASPLRFQEATPPPDLVTRPPAAAPPRPALTPTENSVAIDNAAAAHSISNPPPDAEASSASVAKPTAPARETAGSAKTPPAILPDDSRPAVRPEDFLPYFQIPGAARNPGDVTLLVPAASAAPAPAPLPPSSATYTQTPK